MKINTEKVIIIVLLVLLVWFATAIIRLENYHYAVQVGMCSNSNQTDEFHKGMELDDCLNKTETRTSGIWHLMYGLGIF